MSDGDDEMPFDGSAELIEIQDRLRRIKREGSPRDLRSALKACEKWVEVFKEAVAKNGDTSRGGR